MVLVIAFTYIMWSMPSRPNRTVIYSFISYNILSKQNKLNHMPSEPFAKLNEHSLPLLHYRHSDARHSSVVQYLHNINADHFSVPIVMARTHYNPKYISFFSPRRFQQVSLSIKTWPWNRFLDLGCCFDVPLCCLASYYIYHFSLQDDFNRSRCQQKLGIENQFLNLGCCSGHTIMLPCFDAIMSEYIL